MVISRADPVCPLCAEALAVIETEREKSVHSVHLDLIDICDHSLLQSSFPHDIPVVFVNGRYRFRGHVEPVLLGALLKKAPA